MLKYLLFEHKNTLMREQHLINICVCLLSVALSLINICVCLSGILLTDMCFKLTPVFLLSHLWVTDISKYYKHWNMFITVNK